MNYSGELKDVPQEIIDKMVSYQVAQGNDANARVFDNDINACKSDWGFDWDKTFEYHSFWDDVINNKEYDRFFKLYPKSINEYPKLMMVSDDPITDDNIGVPRVVFMEKLDKHIAWVDATTFKAADCTYETYAWDYAKDIEESKFIELTFEDISNGKGVGIDPKLIRIKK